MKKCLILLCLLPLMAMSPSNTASVKWGPEIPGSKRGSITSTLGYDDNGYYILGYDKGDIQILKLNKKLENAGLYTFEEKDKVAKKTYVYEGTRYFNDKLYIFKSFIDKKTKTVELYSQEISKNTMQETGALNKITELTYEKNRDKGFFSIRVSNGEKTPKLLIAVGTPVDKEENERYTLIMCGEDLKMIWKKEYEIPYRSDLFNRSYFYCDHNGNAYVLGKLYQDKVKEVRRGKQNFEFHILAYTNNGENKVDYAVKLQDKFITDISFDILDNGDIVAGGFYSKKGTATVDGAYYLLLDAKSKETKLSSVKEFDIDFLTQGMTEREEARARKKEEKGKDLELYEYDLHDLIKRDDGGFVLVGEQYYVQVVTSSNGKFTYTTYYYNYNNIIVININNSGKIDWASTIPKRQVSTNDGGFYSSFALAVTADKLRFIYNDNKENLTPKKQGYIKNYTFRDKDGIVTLATIDKDGKIEREALISDADIEVGVRPKVCDQISDNEVLLFGERRKAEQFAILEFK
jgi:hypothetical protein